MTSLVVLNLPGSLGGKENNLVALCRAEGFMIFPTMSEPTQVRIGILNQLSEAQITDIVGRFADAMVSMGAEVDKPAVLQILSMYYKNRWSQLVV